MILALAAAALAEPRRFGLFVGDDAGLPGEPELVFATSDAEKMRDLFVEFGGVRGSDAVLLTDRGAGAVEAELRRLGGLIRAAGDDTTLFFYYSGHGDAESLHLAGTRLAHPALRALLEESGATVKIAMVDACQSGGLVRRKGGARGPDLALHLPVVETTRGTAILTSSAASELSQESTELGSGFFTHYLHTALTGAADADGDGAVTLTEAYSWLHHETAFRTKDAPETQTPTWDLDLSGAGDLVLTDLVEASAHLAFLGDLQGTYGIWDASRKRYVAEIDGGVPLTLAVKPGSFFVHQRMPGYVEEAHYTVRRGETHSVLLEDFETVTYEAVASRGDLERAVRRSKLPDVSLRAVLGIRGFGAGERGWSDTYVPQHAIGGLEAAWLKRHAYWSADLASGGTTSPLEIEGLAPVPARTTTTSVGAALGVVTPPWALRAGAGGRASLNLVGRSFPDGDAARQASAGLGIGGSAFVGVHAGRFSLDLRLASQALVVKWDDNEGWPTYHDLALVTGWRF